MIKLRYFFWKNKKISCKIAGFLFLILLIIVCSCFTYFNYIIPASQRTDTVAIVDTLGVENNSEVYINDGVEAYQTFVGEKYGISTIKIRVNTDGKKENGNLIISLEDQTNNEIINKWDKKISKINSDGIIKLKLKKQIKDASAKTYCLRIEGEGLDKNKVSIYESEEDAFASGQLFVDDNPTAGDMLFAVIPSKVNNHFILKYYKCVILFLAIVLILIWFMVFARKEYAIERVFLIFTLTFGMAYLLVMPAYSAPDEIAHFATAYRLSNKMMHVEGDNDEEYALCRQEDTIKRELNFTTTLETYRYIRLNLFTKNDNKDNAVFTGAKVLQNTSVVAHLAQATGISIARALNLSDVALCFLGQFCVFIFYTILVFFAIKITPVGKQIFFAISSFPMVMSIVPSFSYDPVIYGLSFILIAIILRLIYGVEKVTLKDCIICIIFSLLLAPCKMVYSFISLLVILIPDRKFKNKKSANLFKIITVVASIVYAFISNASAVADSSSGVKMIEWAGAQGFTLTDLLSDIPGTINMYLMTIHEYMGYYLNTMIGGELGWLNVIMPMDIIILSLIVLVLSLREERVKRITDIQKVIYVCDFLLIAALICTSLLLGWTHIYSKVILGIQGRYFIPILPLLLLPFVGATKKEEINARKWVIMGACMINFFVVLRVFEINVLR